MDLEAEVAVAEDLQAEVAVAEAVAVVVANLRVTRPPRLRPGMLCGRKKGRR